MTSKWNLVTGLDVFVLVTVKTLTTRSRRGESRAIWRTHWRPVLCVSLRLMGGFSDEGRIDSRLMIGNGDSASEDLVGEIGLISFSGVLLLVELVNWNVLKEKS